MGLIFICLVSLTASFVTFFSGFGLGTVLLPVFAIFFPIDIAIALTAIVHFLNNIFKFSLIWQSINKHVVLLFGCPAFFASILGAFLLIYIKKWPPLISYSFAGHEHNITWVKLSVASIMMIFVLFDLLPHLKALSFDQKYLPIGGFLSGLFGGFSGHQGALRSAFLIRLGLSKESFIATGVAIACLIDLSRLSVYSTQISSKTLSDNILLLSVAVAAAFLGSWIGNRWSKKVTLKFVQIIVSVMLFIIACLLGGGVI
jgi:uncharacterized membrane protein YfcA